MLPLQVVKNYCEDEVSQLRPVIHYEYIADRMTHPKWVPTTLVRYQNGRLVNAY